MKAYKLTWRCPSCKCNMVLKSLSGITVPSVETCPECGTDMLFVPEHSELLPEEEPLTIKQAKEALLKDGVVLRESVSDQAVLHQCRKALAVVEKVQECLLDEDKPFSDTYHDIWDIMRDAYPYWYVNHD